uniref:hypothetical protein n=1 Tax=Fluoribacter gormanii TaxID=464 RepID=UPI00104193E4
MPLTKDEAESLRLAIANANRQPNTQWGEDFSESHDWHNQTTLENLQKELINVRKNSLNRKTFIVDLNGRNVRVYPHSESNIESDVGGIYARGLDSARAVAEILKHHLEHDK